MLLFVRNGMVPYKSSASTSSCSCALDWVRRRMASAISKCSAMAPALPPTALPALRWPRQGQDGINHLRRLGPQGGNWSACARPGGPGLRCGLDEQPLQAEARLALALPGLRAMHGMAAVDDRNSSALHRTSTGSVALRIGDRRAYDRSGCDNKRNHHAASRQKLSIRHS